MLDRSDFTPLYIQVYEVLKKELAKYPVGTNIPPERTLCGRYGVDRVTVRKALTMLADEGLIERRQGRGTKVIRHEEGVAGSVLFLLSQGKKKTDRIGEPFYAGSFDAIEEQLKKNGRRLFYANVIPEDDIAGLCRNTDARAVILSCTPDDPVLERCRALDLPVICYNTCAEGIPSVTVDNDDATSASARLLLGLGHRKIGFIQVLGYVNSEKRLDRYRIETARSHEGDTELFVADGDWTEEGGYRAAYELLSDREKRITALFGGNDSMAIGAMRAAKDLGLNVPGDVSIIGFDGIPQSATASPSLTTVRVDLKAMAESVCMLLEHVISNRECKGIRVLVPADLVIRESTAEARY